MTVLGNSVGIIEEGMSVTPSDGGSAIVKIFMMSVVLLVGMGVGVKRWFYPFTMNDLAREIEQIWELIEENTTRHWDLLGPSGWGFRERLYQECDMKTKIENRSAAVPDWNVVAWSILQWREMRDVKECYLSLMAIKKDITTVVVESRERHQSNASNLDNATAARAIV
ncbi:hypothetical protein PQX77_022195 [Marasmius sp. AFHP31]|nr:hypothetical protein PQX77_022195 [Marasmius sp. AFHP31]